jgi:hypothetical protein
MTGVASPKAKAYEVNYFRDVGRANGETVSTSSSSFNVGGENEMGCVLLLLAFQHGSIGT